MVNVRRSITVNIRQKLFKGKVIIIYGPRRVGKTTLVNDLISTYATESTYLNCDEPDIRAALEDKTSTELKSFVGDKRLIVIDEAQRVRNIGITLKLLIDTFPEMQIIATGSSSFELSNEIVEPLTGRKHEFFLYPFAMHELDAIRPRTENMRLLERRMICGMYPEVVLQSDEEAEETVKEIARSYLYKDILSFANIRNAEVLDKLLRALALQIGNEVSYNEIATLIGVDKNTVASYIDILEKAYVIFRLPPFARNVRNELKKLRKVYFYDVGIRNALIRNFNRLEIRQDTGALWENFLIVERMKRNSIIGYDCVSFFWRTHARQEIDYIEEAGGTLHAFEFKWREKPYTPPRVFTENYPDATVTCVSRSSIESFVY